MSAGQHAAAVHASRNTHSPIGTISADLLGERDELIGRHDALFRMAPTQQRFETGHHAGMQVDQRLVEQLELASLQRLAKVEFQQAAHLHLRVHFGLEQAINRRGRPTFAR